MQGLLQAGANMMVKGCMGETLLMLAVCKEDWESASSLFAVGGYELLSEQNCLGLTCLDMMPTGWKDDEGAAVWIQLVQARDEQCNSFVRHFVQKDISNPSLCLEIYGGDTSEISLICKSNVTAALFRCFATVRAGSCMAVLHTMSCRLSRLARPSSGASAQRHLKSQARNLMMELVMTVSCGE